MSSASAVHGADAPYVSVIIPAKNAEITLSEQLSALADQSFGGSWEVVVADNGSTDRTAEIALGFSGSFQSLRVVDASATAGSSHARNVGAAAAQGELLCFCDADDVVDRDWLKALADAAAKWPVVGGRLETHSLNDVAVRGWRPASHAETARDQITFAPSGNMAIHAGVFAALGGFDEGYLKSHDVEFSRRVKAAGYEIGFCPKALVAYRLRSSMRGIAQQGYRAGRAGAQSYSNGHEQPRTLSATLRDWGWLLARIPTLMSRRRRGIWVRRTGEAAGRVAGSVRWRVRYL